MAFYGFMDPAKMSPARRERFAYWRTVPLRRLGFLLLAVFFTFGTIGLLVSIASARGTPLAVGLVYTAFFGGTAVGSSHRRPDRRQIGVYNKSH